MLDRPAKALPLVHDIAYLEPALYASRLRDQRSLLLMESVMRHEHLGRWSFLCCNPSAELRVEKGQAFLDGVLQSQAPLDILRSLLADNPQEMVKGCPPFQGGYAGYLSYDFGWSLINVKSAPGFLPLCPDLVMNRYDTVVAFDHLQEKAFIIGTLPDEIVSLEKMLRRKAYPSGTAIAESWQSNFTRGAYETAVSRIVDYILAGDVFQANLTQCFSSTAPVNFDGFALYHSLREKNPATFASYFDFGGGEIVSSSPERLVKMQDRKLEARPIKGTRRRDENPLLDAELVADLLASPKDRAENVMIVDLLRNDLSRLAKPGSVTVPVLCGLETYANVHHLVSVVEAEARDGLDAVDLLKAVFPGGSITGAPKIRAMEIIAELEGQARGVYCGSIGYLGFNGTADFNIAIRTALITGGKAFVQGGGGITARSQPDEEYDESLTKIARLRQAFS